MLSPQEGLTAAGYRRNDVVERSPMLPKQTQAVKYNFR